MKPRNVIIIPPSKPDQPDHRLGTPGKIHVVGYARVIKGTGAGVQIRKNIRRLIANRQDWELTYVTTDHRETKDQKSTWRSFLSICHGVRCRHIDILIIHSADDLEGAIAIARGLLPLCKSHGVEEYVAHNDRLLTESEFMQDI